MNFKSFSPVPSKVNVPTNFCSVKCKLIDPIKIRKRSAQLSQKKLLYPKPVPIVTADLKLYKHQKQSYCSSYSLQIASLLHEPLVFFTWITKTYVTSRVFPGNISSANHHPQTTVLASYFKWSPWVPWKSHNLVLNCVFSSATFQNDPMQFL